MISNHQGTKIRAKAEITARKSVVGGGADLPRAWLELRLVPGPEVKVSAGGPQPSKMAGAKIGPMLLKRKIGTTVIGERRNMCSGCR